MKKLYCDLETYSTVPIKYGSHAYAEKARVLLFAYAIDDNPPKCWDVENDPRNMPEELRECLYDYSVQTVWHNGGMFDRVVLKHAMPDVYNSIPVDRWYDTMVQAFAHGLPGSLDTLCEIFKLPIDQRKLKTGSQLIHLFCKPRPATSKIQIANAETHPLEWAQFMEYAMMDIVSMRELHKRMPTWNYSGQELKLWHLDQKVNMRGVRVDVPLAESAIRAVALTQLELRKRTQELTKSDVESATQRGRLLEHILSVHGVSLPDMQKSTLERRINDDSIPLAVRELLAIRLQASATSTSKYQTLINSVSSDGRLRGTLQFCGAQRTGRWSGRLFQPQNLPRPTLSQETIEMSIEALKHDCAHLIVDNVMEATSSAVRGCLIPSKNKKFCVSDLSNIEGRKLAWLTGEQWKLKAFADFDAGVGHDLYKLAYAKSFNVKPESVDKDQRQIGKVMELALGFQGGVGAFFTFAAAYGIDLEKLADIAWDSLPLQLRADAENFYEWVSDKAEKRADNREGIAGMIQEREEAAKTATFGLSKRAFVTCDTFKRAWRQSHPNIAAWWGELETAVKSAIANPGAVIKCRKVRFIRTGAWLRAILPSGRSVCYPFPQINDLGEFWYSGVNQYTRKWARVQSYGGKIAENLTQASARDVMAAAMPGAEAAGYEIVLTVHDELITETPDNPDYNHERLSEILATPPLWAKDMPIAAGGFETKRYKKA